MEQDEYRRVTVVTVNGLEAQVVHGTRSTPYPSSAADTFYRILFTVTPFTVTPFTVTPTLRLPNTADTRPARALGDDAVLYLKDYFWPTHRLLLGPLTLSITTLKP